MISPEIRAQIRRCFYAEHWKIGTIAAELGVHPDTVRNAIESERFRSAPPIRASLADPYLAFVRQTLEQHPRLRATRLHAMLRDRGYAGSVVQLRRAVARLRPQKREPFLQLHVMPGEQAQVDWAHFGHVMVGRAKRALSCFVMTLSYSRALYLEFFFDQTMENFLRGHIHGFTAWGGQPRVILLDFVAGHKIEVLWRTPLCGAIARNRAGQGGYRDSWNIILRAIRAISANLGSAAIRLLGGMPPRNRRAGGTQSPRPAWYAV